MDLLQVINMNDQYESLTGKKILPSNQSQMKAKFTYTPLGKVLEK